MMTGVEQLCAGDSQSSSELKKESGMEEEKISDWIIDEKRREIVV